jgi:hemerythrin-like domain-containing protein
MGGPRLSRAQSVEALEEGIDVIRALWDVDQHGGARYDGKHYRLNGTARGPAPVHDVQIWVGAYKPRMLDLVGRKADGWLPSLPYLEQGDLARGNQAIDNAAATAGRDPKQIRRMLNIAGSFSGAGRGPLEGTPATWAEELTRLALDDGVGTFIVMADDSATLETFATEVAPRVREEVAAHRLQAAQILPRPRAPVSVANADEVEYGRLGVTPTPDPGIRLSSRAPWDETTRPHRAASGPDVAYSEIGRSVGKHLVDVHNALRTELTELRDVLAQVRDGAMTAGNARSVLNEMALRQNDWTLGAFCARYCGVVTQHHGMEDDAIFPHLARSDAGLPPVINRLRDEHLVIHDAIQDVDRALVRHINHPENYDGIQAAIDFLTDSLLSHLSYEEVELVEPLARFGFYPNQV